MDWKWKKSPNTWRDCSVRPKPCDVNQSLAGVTDVLNTAVRFFSQLIVFFNKYSLMCFLVFFSKISVQVVRSSVSLLMVTWPCTVCFAHSSNFCVCFLHSCVKNEIQKPQWCLYSLHQTLAHRFSASGCREPRPTAWTSSWQTQAIRHQTLVNNDNVPP